MVLGDKVNGTAMLLPKDVERKKEEEKIEQIYGSAWGCLLQTKTECIIAVIILKIGFKIVVYEY